MFLLQRELLQYESGSTREDKDTRMEGLAKLKQDLVILETMAGETAEYLQSDVLFWPLQGANLPRLTLGAYLLRRHRLFALQELLDEDERRRLSAAVQEFQAALAGSIVRVENRAIEELEVRLRQWERHLNGYAGEERSNRAYYATSVETRAIMEALLNELEAGPYQLPARLPERRDLLDSHLRSRWRSGPFIWPEAWRPAYPKAAYWWLYGVPA